MRFLKFLTFVVLISAALACNNRKKLITTEMTTTHSPIPSETPLLSEELCSNVQEKNECGFLGITKDACIAENCCWLESEIEGEPWCFHI